MVQTDLKLIGGLMRFCAFTYEYFLRYEKQHACTDQLNPQAIPKHSS